MSIVSQLESRRQEGRLRSLRTTKGLIDFCSNDYLGFARDIESGEGRGLGTMGSTGSRLITGNSSYVEELEQFIADYHDAECGLIFNSGYDANLGLFSSVPQRGDTVLFDEYCHASIRDGLRLGYCRSHSFPHNDLESLERLLLRAEGNVFVAVESVYSMDGTFADLAALVSLAEKHKARLIVDEAHATGLFGERGQGRVVELNLQARVYARIHTFGKALGRHGAIVLGDQNLRVFLINYARSFIYTTSLPESALMGVKSAYDKLSKINFKELKLRRLQGLFTKLVEECSALDLIESFSPIQGLICGSNTLAKSLSQALENEGIFVYPILSPTVPKGTERLRICMHEFNTEDEVLRLVNCLKLAKK
ncbi:MAG: pyridoxal phosphate-dependent aminotransferase family protein [Flavobacteriales bacterium]|nr:pyridoxal phosphate-dependent aminotransferase family protein [Flavobacteriales bacterium]